MASPKGRTFVVWVVAVAASIETILAATVAALAHRTTEFAVWSIGSFAVIGAAALVERLKVEEGG